jgi:hypothetical protein
MIALFFSHLIRHLRMEAVKVMALDAEHQKILLLLKKAHQTKQIEVSLSIYTIGV